jgi:hypothetical protein
MADASTLHPFAEVTGCRPCAPQVRERGAARLRLTRAARHRRHSRHVACFNFNAAPYARHLVSVHL